MENLLLAETVKELGESQKACAGALEAIAESMGAVQAILAAHQRRIAMLEQIIVAAHDKLTK